MNNYFDRELKYLERELTHLKTARQKSATAVGLISHSVNVSIPLSLNSSQTSATGFRAYAIDNGEYDQLATATLDWYIDNIYDYWKPTRLADSARKASVQMGIYRNSQTVVVRGTGSHADIETLKGGGSVSVNVTLTVTSTGDFTLRSL